jgi:hypothetical protein
VGDLLINPFVPHLDFMHAAEFGSSVLQESQNTAQRYARGGDKS